MRASRTVQLLSYELRLPDASREVINATVAALWERLDEFSERESKYAYKQVTALIGSSEPHGDRQWRCEAEQAGRILRGQAERKKQFALVLPLLQAGMIQPKTEKKPAGKNRTAIKAAQACLREEDMQPIPVLKVGILPYAADDGGEHGQAYRLRLDLEGRCCYFAFRAPDQTGQWSPSWTEPLTHLALPDPAVERLQAGESLAPTLREIAEPDGTRYAVLDLIVEVPVAPLPDPQQVCGAF